MPGRHRHALDRGRGSLELAPVQIAAGDQRGALLLPLQDHTALRLVAGELDGAIEQRLVGHQAAGFDATGRGDHHPGLHIVDARRELVGGKAPNTTEWMAPMRAQASMAMAASGTMGM